MPDVRSSAEIDAPADAVWELVGRRFGDIAVWAEMIDASRMLSADVRECQTRVGTVHERLLVFDDAARTLTYEAFVGPRWMRRGENRWTVTALGERRCRVESFATVEIEPSGAGRLVADLPQLMGLTGALRDLKVYAETGAPARRGVSQGPLWANAAFSAGTGLALALDLGGLASRFGGQAVGVGLVGFALLVAWVAREARPVHVLAISAADLLWVGASAVALAVQADPWVSGAAAVVLALTLAQLRGVREAVRDRTPGRGAWRHCVAVDVPADPQAMWEQVGDLARIAEFLPSLVESRLRDGRSPGVGAVRACRNQAGAAWAEQVVRYSAEERAFEVRFLADEPGFPYPARAMWGGWSVRPRRGGARVEVWWSLDPTIRVLPWLAVALMGPRVDRSIAQAVGRMAGLPSDRDAALVPSPC